MADDTFAQDEVRRRIERDIARRIAVHKANIARLAAAQASASLLGAPVLNRPLVLLAQGDSWFDYPLTGNGLPLVDTDVVAQLRRIGPMPPTILNLAHHGDAAVGMMSLEKQSRMIAALRDPSNWIDGKPDAILFSAGGNDIAGEQFCIFLDFNDGKAKGLDTERFAGALGMVEACYLALFAMRDRVAPGVPILAHCYDFPIPNGAHPPCAGPWLKPSLDFCNWSTAAGTTIVREALVAFKAMLARLAANPANRFHLIDTQGTLSAAEWANELHPGPAGFARIAQIVAAALDGLVRPPARIQALAALAASSAGQDTPPAEPGGRGKPVRGTHRPKS
ncbi:SGNH/GDSL hydrolase family protein [Methylobacterium sp. SyP6R]|uniref:SGNH/GDSL hydrolase family protein n=1 Tax=Methylobacterium sp. SyP6R TaxID=2718876 RepID=UPI001F45C2D9|nr:SGNH/GDSL hydrolase family protein [Methylobacterium sp. SyP6R]MCF4129310.1 SGNH/GDSL hydrolase family protein [Methylobacterium sp. SyP6R]